MPFLKRFLVRYLLFFLLIYVALLSISHIPALRNNIKDWCRARTERVLTRRLPDAIFISDPKRIGQTEKASQITLAYGNRAEITEAVQGAGSAGMDVKLLNYEVDPIFLMGYFFFLSLLIVSPIPWKRKLLSFVIGSVLLYWITNYALYVFAIEKIANADIGIYELSDRQRTYYSTIGKILNNAIIFVFPVLIWGIVSFRKGDLSQEIWREKIKAE